jgi:hypothetical protein
MREPDAATGWCHCGAVTLTVPRPPSWVVQCGCSICAKLGVLWAYYPDADGEVTGPTDTYVCNNRVIAFHRCRTCGCTTHWRTLGKDFGRMGINARLLDGFDSAAVQVRVVPGPTPEVFAADWPPSAPTAARSPTHPESRSARRTP